jgi:hypothetical protein
MCYIVGYELQCREIGANNRFEAGHHASIGTSLRQSPLVGTDPSWAGNTIWVQPGEAVG